MVELNEYGFYSLKEKPDKKALKEYYSKKYYQEEEGSYKKQYSLENTTYINNKIEQRYNLFNHLLPKDKRLKLLDIGCGEGFCLSYFHKIDFEVVGLDFSEYGTMNHNPEMKDFIISGDIYENIDSLKQKSEKFDVIWIDNVLEHVLDPLKVLQDCFELCANNGVLLIEVPNDFSSLQMELKKQEIIDIDFWVAIPDHISYFNRNGLSNICKKAGWKTNRIIADFPIDFNLFNQNANYVNNKETGSEAHLQRIKIDNLMHNISVEKTNNFYEALADLGMGRQIIGLFIK